MHTTRPTSCHKATPPGLAGELNPCRRQRCLAALALGIFLQLARPVSATAADDWISLGGLAGMNGANFAVACDDAGTTYVGGGFTGAGDTLAWRVAAWRGQRWNPLGAGMNDTVWALAVSGPDLYAAGAFLRATNADGSTLYSPKIARWDGRQWSALGRGLGGTAYAVVKVGTNVFAGGSFGSATNSDGMSVIVPKIARWDGVQWCGLGDGLNGTVYALAASGTNLYAAGDFTAATNPDGSVVYASKIACWNGTEWSSLGGGVDGTVECLAVADSGLYLGGFFSSAANDDGSVVPSAGIVRWTGSNWSAVGGGMGGTVYCLAGVGPEIYAGGLFSVATNADGMAVAAHNIAKWNGSVWAQVGLGTDGAVVGSVYGLAASGGKVCAVGAFTVVANAGPSLVNAASVAQWDGMRWSRMSESAGLNATARCVARLGADVYFGGDFSMAGDCETPALARWNGRDWSAVGRGLNGSVLALANWGTNLLVAGAFSSATSSAGQSIPAAHLVCWDGWNWQPLGGGLNGSVYALAPAGDVLYVGGAFTAATNTDGSVVQASRIAKWDGRTWSPLAGGLSAGVMALLVRGQEIYAGGNFVAATNADNTSVVSPCIARWDGKSWTPLGGGAGSATVFGQACIYALAANGTNLYVGGDLATTTNSDRSTVSTCGVARWDGQSWSAINTNFSSASKVRALGVIDTNLYIGGWMLGQRSLYTLYNLPCVLRWNGFESTMVASWVSGNVNAMSLLGPNLYVANCTLAGAKTSGYAAVLPLGLASPAALLSPRVQQGRMLFDISTLAGTGYTVEATPSLSQPDWTPVAIFDGDGTTRTLAVPQPTPSEGYYRVRSL